MTSDVVEVVWQEKLPDGIHRKGRRHREMAKEWNDRNRRFDLNGRSAGESFERHNRRMGVFCRSHAEVAMVN